MRLTYIGHACFLAESDAGVRVLMDPYVPDTFGGRITLRPFRERVDVVTSSHAHLDHRHEDPAFGDPAYVYAPGTAAGIRFDGVPLPHDALEGAQRGLVTGFRFEVDGVTIFHPGDLGRPLTDAEAAALGRVDVLLLPVGGTFTIDPAGALRTIAVLRPAVAIPMHYLVPAVRLQLLPLDDFLALVPGFERVPVQPMRFDRATLPAPTRVLVPDPLHG
jgi:L-ascorbate metabolism protein UlaG (beta-lactamase superfamily)